MGHSRSLFLYYCLFNTVDGKLNLPMTGFELRISGIGSARSTNRATTTTLQSFCFHCPRELFCSKSFIVKGPVWLLRKKSMRTRLSTSMNFACHMLL